MPYYGLDDVFNRNLHRTSSSLGTIHDFAKVVDVEGKDRSLYPAAQQADFQPIRQHQSVSAPVPPSANQTAVVAAAAITCWIVRFQP